MKRSFIIFFAVICIAAISVQDARAQDAKTESMSSGFPIAPITVEFRLISQFFRQSLTIDSKYSSIDAFVGNQGNAPWYEIVLREKASSQQVYYCNSQSTVAMLSGRGEQAYYAPIDFNSSQSSDSHPVFTFQFQDNSKQSIQWRFVAGSPVAGRDGVDRFMARPDDSGFVLLHLHQPIGAAPGTVLSIGEEQNPADHDAFYAADVLVAAIPPVTEQWNVASAPSQARISEKWVLRNKTGSENDLTIQRISGDRLSLEMKGPDSQTTDQLDVQQSANQYTLASMTVSTQGHSLRISFDPALPLPSAMANDKTEVKFTVDEDSSMAVASGQLTAVRGLADEHMQWHFESPDWAKSKRLNTGASVLFGSETKELKKAQNAIP